jgi:hypothetical protein
VNLHESVLIGKNQGLTRVLVKTILTTEAAKEPFDQRRRWPMSSTTVSGTSKLGSSSHQLSRRVRNKGYGPRLQIEIKIENEQDTSRHT